MDKALLDTDIFSEILKGINQRVADRASTYRSAFGCYTICIVTVIEIVIIFAHWAAQRTTCRHLVTERSRSDIMQMFVAAGADGVTKSEISKRVAAFITEHLFPY